MKIFVTGIAGTGKTTIANNLSNRGFNVIDVDHVHGLCSWVNQETGEKSEVGNLADVDNEFIDYHDYVCNINLLKKMMSQIQGKVFVFGSVGDNSDFVPLFDKVILLQCSPETLIDRLQSRGTNSFGKDPDSQTRILEWKKHFDKLMLDVGAKEIDTEKEPDVVVNKVLEYACENYGI